MIKKNSITNIIMLLIALQGIFLFSSCTHITLPTEQNEGILVTGSATVQSPPDLATLQVGVQSFAETAQQATADNNLKVEKIITSLKNKGLTDEDPTPLRQKARRAAMEDALSRAEILAEAIDVEVGKPISIQELSYGGPVVQAGAIAELAMDAKVPIQAPNDVGTKIDLQVRFEIK